MPSELDPDALVARFLLQKLRADELEFEQDYSGRVDDAAALKHLMICPDAQVSDTSGREGASDTGAEYAMLSCLAECPHVTGQQLCYSEWGLLSNVLNAIEQDGESA